MLIGNKSYNTAEDLPEIVPVFPLSGTVLLPGGQMPLNIFEKRYIAMFDAAMETDRIIGIVQPHKDALGHDQFEKTGADERVTALHENEPPLFQVGCFGRVTSLAETGDGRYMTTLTGICRFRIVDEIPSKKLFRQCRVKPFLNDLVESEESTTVDRKALLVAFRAYLEANELEADWDSIERAQNQTLVNALCMMSPFGSIEKQALLEAPDLKTRAETLVAITEMMLAKELNDQKSILQ